MKKIIIPIIAVLFLASCKKERTCTCTSTPVSFTVNGVTQPVDPTPSTTVTKYDKTSKDETNCVSGEMTFSASDVQGGTQYTYSSVTKQECTLD